MRRYTALTLIALAASSTAAPPALKLAQTPPAHRLSIPEVYDKLVQKKNSAFEVATEFKNQLKSRIFEYRSGLADVRAAVTGDHARRRLSGVLDDYFSDIQNIAEAFSNHGRGRPPRPLQGDLVHEWRAEDSPHECD